MGHMRCHTVLRTCHLRYRRALSILQKPTRTSSNAPTAHVCVRAMLPAMSNEKSHFVLRCPYCVSGEDFRPLIATTDGRFYCVQCGHTASPHELTYVCSCAHCVRVSQAAVRLENRRVR